MILLAVAIYGLKYGHGPLPVYTDGQAANPGPGTSWVQGKHGIWTKARPLAGECCKVQVTRSADGVYHTTSEDDAGYKRRFVSETHPLEDVAEQTAARRRTTLDDEELEWTPESQPAAPLGGAASPPARPPAQLWKALAGPDRAKFHDS